MYIASGNILIIWFKFLYDSYKIKIAIGWNNKYFETFNKIEYINLINYV